MADIQVVTLGTVGPTGPGTVTPGAVITTRGAFIIGDASAVPAALTIGTTGKFIRSDGTDPSWQAITAADLPTAIDAAKLADASVSNTEFQYLNGVTSALQTQLDAKASSTHAHITDTLRGIYIAQDAISAATPSDNTASTTLWSNALESSFTLPTGTWKVHVIGGVALRHSAAGSVQARVTINSQDSTSRTFSITSSSVYVPVIDDDTMSGVAAGTCDITLQFHSNDAGTTYAKNPWWFAVCERTA